MNYILVMTLSGSCMFLLYFCQKYTVGKYMSKSWQYLFLKIVTLYYLIPLPYLAALYRKIIRTILSRPSSGSFHYDYNKKVLYRAGNYFVLSDGYQRRLMAAGLWCLIAGIIFAVHFIHYMGIRRRVLKNGGADIAAEDKAALERQKSRLRIRQEVALCRCDDPNTAFVMGMRKPVIVCTLPEDPLEKEMLLGHELMHVKRSDVFWKMAGSIVLGLHWFNPFVYWLEREMEFVCEISCDELAVEGYTEEERYRYAAMLVERSAGRNASGGWGTALSKNGKRIMERAEIVVKCGREKKKWNGIVSGLFISALVMLNSVTVLAYEEVTVARMSSAEEIEERKTWEIRFTATGEIDPWIDIIWHEKQFVDEDGNIYPVEEEKSVYADCSHTYQKGIYKGHSEDGGEGCEMVYSESIYCMKCGDCIITEPIGTGTFTRCIHYLGMK